MRPWPPRPDRVERRRPDAGPASDVGHPAPDPQLAAGTVTVRVIRGSFANPVVSLTVELIGGSSPRQRDHDRRSGRAEFTGLAPGTRVKAVAVVAGERLESQEFTMPASGGIRLTLVAADPSGQPLGGCAGGSAPEPVRPNRARWCSARTRGSSSRWAKTA